MEPVGVALGVIGITGAVGSARRKINSYKDYEGDSRYARVWQNVNKQYFQRCCTELGYNQGKLEPGHHEALDDPEVRAVFDGLMQCLLETDSGLDDERDEPTSDNDAANEPKPDSWRFLWNRPQKKGTRRQEKPNKNASRIDKAVWAMGHKDKVFQQNERVAALFGAMNQLLPHRQEQSALSDLNGKLDRFIADAAVEVRNTVAQIRQTSRKEVEQWFGNQWSEETHEGYIPRRLNGTCGWVLGLAEFQDWEKIVPEKPSILWIKGLPGYGKTMICSRIVDHLVEVSGSCPFAYFYTSLESDARSDPFSIIRSWTTQLILSNEQALSLAESRKEDMEGRMARKTDIEALLHGILASIPGCILIVDGLDECAGTAEDHATSYRNPIVEFFEFLEGAISGTQTRVLFTSRNSPDIQENLYAQESKHAWRVSRHDIRPSDVKDDATIYARSIVDRKFSHKTEKARHELADIIIERGDSMFMWIKTIQDRLRSGQSQKALEWTIREAPVSLDHLYDQNWSTIQTHTDTAERAVSILRWCSWAGRPLTVAELAGALRFSETCNNSLLLDEDQIPTIDEMFVQTEIEGICQGLVETRGSTSIEIWEDRTVHLAHATVREYIAPRLPIPKECLSGTRELTRSHEAIHQNLLAESCLRCLGIVSFPKTEDRPSGHLDPPVSTLGHIMSPFWRYATEAWPMHVRQDAPNARSTNDMIFSFFSQSSTPCNSFCYWATCFDRLMMRTVQGLLFNTGYSYIVHHWPNPLFYAAYFGFQYVLERLINEQSLDVDSADSGGRKALLAAASSGEGTIVSYLLERGSDVNMCHRGVGTPLLLASIENHSDVVELLLQSGADPSIASSIYRPGTYSGTPLLNACRRGHFDVCRLLVENGASASDPGQYSNGRTPLSEACVSGRLDICRLLLEKGATLDSSDEYPPLLQACRGGHFAICQLLLEKGADVSVTDENESTPLTLACASNNLSIVELLIEYGADVKAESSGSSTLHLCIPTNVDENLMERGSDVSAIDSKRDRISTDIARLLIERGVDVSGVNSEGRTPLHLACEYGNVDLARLLIDKDAILSVKDNKGLVPLHLACSHGSLEVTRLLIEKGADPGQSGENENPLSLAARRGRTEIVSFLTDPRNQLLDLTNSHHATDSLLQAIIKGNIETVRVLLDNGADASYTNRKRVNTVFKAVEMGNVDIVHLLADRGADLDIPDRYQWRPIHLAAFFGRHDILRILAEKGANLDIRQWEGRSAAHYAAAHGHIEFLRELRRLGGSASLQARTPDGHTVLHVAAMCGQLEVVKFLMSECDASMALTVDHEGSTPLHRAIKEGQCDSAECLLQEAKRIPVMHTSQHSLINIRNNDGHTPLTRAVCRGDTTTSMIDIMLAHGARATMNEQNCFGETALHVACRRGSLEAVELLLREGADKAVGIQDRDGHEPLILAIDRGHHGMIQVMLDNERQKERFKGNQIGLDDSLFHAIRNNNPLLAKFLTNAGADPNGTAWTPAQTFLYVASCQGSSELVGVLLEAGAKPDETSTDGSGPAWTPLRSAVINGYPEIVKLLLEAGADVNRIEDNLNFSSPLLIACDRWSSDVVTLLLNAGADATLVTSNEDTTPLIVACDTQNWAMVKILLEHKASSACNTLNHRALSGLAALHFACAYGHSQTVQLMITKGCDVNLPATQNNLAQEDEVDDEGGRKEEDTEIDEDDEVFVGWTALHMASITGSLKTVKMLLKNGADPCIRNGGGRTALHYASMRGLLKIVNILLKNGADPCIEDEKGQTALYYAREKGHNKVAGILERSLSSSWWDCLDLEGYRTGRTPEVGAGLAAPPDEQSQIYGSPRVSSSSSPPPPSYVWHRDGDAVLGDSSEETWNPGVTQSELPRHRLDESEYLSLTAAGGELDAEALEADIMQMLQHHDEESLMDHPSMAGWI